MMAHVVWTVPVHVSLSFHLTFQQERGALCCEYICFVDVTIFACEYLHSESLGHSHRVVQSRPLNHIKTKKWLTDVLNNVMLCISSKTYLHHKTMPGRLAYSLVLYRIVSAIANLRLVSFRCKVKIREGQVEETAWCYCCNRWWRRTCRGAGEESE